MNKITAELTAEEVIRLSKPEFTIKDCSTDELIKELVVRARITKSDTVYNIIQGRNIVSSSGTIETSNVVFEFMIKEK